MRERRSSAELVWHDEDSVHHQERRSLLVLLLSPSTGALLLGSHFVVALQGGVYGWLECE
jgi:hypothetical protein